MTFNKFAIRTLPSVVRSDASPLAGSSQEPEWYQDFLKHLEKNSVKSQQSIYDEISAILGNTKSKYSSVDEAVNDMKERSGLAAFLKQKQASAVEPTIFKDIPQMKIFIDNFVSDRPGTSVESVVHDLLKINDIRNKLPDKTDVDNEVKSYINGKLAEISRDKSDSNHIDMNLGKVDTTEDVKDNNPFAICEPAKV